MSENTLCPGPSRSLGGSDIDTGMECLQSPCQIVLIDVAIRDLSVDVDIDFEIVQSLLVAESQCLPDSALAALTIADEAVHISITIGQGVTAGHGQPHAQAASAHIDVILRCMMRVYAVLLEQQFSILAKVFFQYHIQRQGRMPTAEYERTGGGLPGKNLIYDVYCAQIAAEVRQAVPVADVYDSAF